MGFDVYGQSGNYFRNNVWWWRPLWTYVSITCSDILSKYNIKHGCYNDGHFINKDKAERIAQRLSEKINSGEAMAYVEKYEEERKAIPLEKCEYCEGTGKRFWEGVGYKKCNGCDGKGERESYQSWYPISIENIKEFADFCSKSDGFKIH